MNELQKKKKKKLLQARQRNDQKSNSSDSEDDDSDQDQQDSFIVDDDSYDDQSYVRPPLDDDYSEDKKKKKKKKKKEKQRKRNKYQDEDDFDDGDLALVDEYEQDNRLKRLRKKKEEKRKDDLSEYEEEEEEDLQADMEEDQIGEDDFGYERDGGLEEEEFSNLMEVQNNEQVQLDALFDPKIIGKYYREPEDQEIVNFDIPERQFIKYMNYAKVTKMLPEKIKEECEAEDRRNQAKWIFQRLRNMGYFEVHDQRTTSEKIYNVLVAMHKDHLEIMYIYYYRKKIWGDVLNLSLLQKIEQADEEWFGFKREQQRLQTEIVTIIQSFQEVPKGVHQLLKQCTEMKTLRYIKDYADFMSAKHKPSLEIKSNNKKVNIIKQICEKRVNDWLQKNEVFLSPQSLCHNFKSKLQEKKPKTPQQPPDQVLSSLLKNEDPAKDEEDRNKYPLLTPDRRILTLCQYLAMELFNYPELRKILKEKYYKKLVITTTPTVKGNQNINLYSTYFPVKRIKEKPVASLRKEVWILATEAEKLNLITIELKFQWELGSEDKRNFQSDSVYLEITKYYFSMNRQQSSNQMWNVFRKQVLIRMLNEFFFPSFMKEVKEQLTKDGQKQIIQIACHKFRAQLNKGPSQKQGKPIKILSMVMEKDKLGMAFIDEKGQSHYPLKMTLLNDEDLKNFVTSSVLYKYIDDHKPDMILISANCRKAQTLRKELRNPNLFQQSIFCAFGEYEIPNLMANKNMIQGISEEKAILEAISMARLKKNPMAETLALWSDNLEENAILSINYHPLQKCVNKRKLMQALERVAIQMVNLVGLDLSTISAEHLSSQLQFICGLGPRKAFSLLEKLKSYHITNRTSILKLVSGKYVYQNCSPFFKIQTQYHTNLLNHTIVREKNKSKSRQDEEINLFDMTRIPEQWYSITQRLFTFAVRGNNLLELKQKKFYSRLPDQTISTIEMFRNPDKLRNIDWENRKQEANIFYDENFVKGQIMNRFKNPRDPEKVIDNKEIFYSLLKETPETLKKYMVVTVKILSVNQQYLNVVIPQNGLFGHIKINQTKNEYQKGNFIKAVITGFPFDEKKSRNRSQDDQELLKVEMQLNFPHKAEERNQDWFSLSFPTIVKQIHPLIDLEKDNFDLRKEDKPVIEVKEEVVKPRNDLRRISHPKFKNISIRTAIEQVRMLGIGDFVIRPSTEGNEYLTITWNFYKNVVTHLKLKMEQKTMASANYIFRVLDRDRDKIFSSLDEVIEKFIRPMNALVQDVISNKKFLPLSLDQVEEKIKSEMGKDPSHIHYFFCTTTEYPQYFILVYMYKEKKPTRELIKIRSSGMFFHDQQFQNLRELINWFKQNLKEKDYQRYARNNSIKR